MDHSLPNDSLTAEIYDLLFHLGLTADHIYFFHTALALRLAVETPQRLSLTTKWLYPDVAKQCLSTPAAVEKNIRSAAAEAWNTNPELLSLLSCLPLSHKPTASQFLSILLSAFFPDMPFPPV